MHPRDVFRHVRALFVRLSEPDDRKQARHKADPLSELAIDGMRVAAQYVVHELPALPGSQHDEVSCFVAEDGVGPVDDSNESARSRVHDQMIGTEIVMNESAGALEARQRQ